MSLADGAIIPSSSDRRATKRRPCPRQAAWAPAAARDWPGRLSREPSRPFSSTSGIVAAVAPRRSGQPGARSMARLEAALSDTPRTPREIHRIVDDMTVPTIRSALVLLVRAGRARRIGTIDQYYYFRAADPAHGGGR